jgi:hypothetical protein
MKKKVKSKRKKPIRSPIVLQENDGPDNIININSKNTEFHDMKTGHRSKVMEIGTQHSHPEMPKIDQSQSAMSKTNTSYA